MKTALILGINGQDGSYLADILLEKGYTVHGLVRRNSQPNLWRIEHCLEQLSIHQGDVTDSLCLQKLIEEVQPDEIYNEADQDHVGFSFASPKLSVDVTYGAVASLLEIIKGSQIKLFQPLSATMFGNAVAPQTLETPFSPQSPYACAKVAAYYLCQHYREKYGTRVYTAILYNHDSVRRQGSYLLHDICRNAVKIKHGDEKHLPVKYLNLPVDIGWAKDHMQCVYKLLRHEPLDITIGTGFANTIYDMVQHALNCVGLNHSPKHYSRDTTTNIEPSSWLQNAYRNLGSKSVFQLIEDLCQHYEDKLYGGKP